MKQGNIYLMVIVGFFALSWIGADNLSYIAMQSTVNNFDKTVESEKESEKVDKALTEAKNLADSNSLEFYFPSYITDKTFFETAYKKSSVVGKEVDKFDNDVKAGILPHHLVFPEKIAQFFDKLAKTQNVNTFFVIGPNHSHKGNFSIAISEYGYSTPYGNLDIDEFKVNKILGLKLGYIGFDKNSFDGEYSISALVPFIKKSFPDAKIVPIVIKGGTDDKYIAALTKAISGIAGPSDFVLGSVDFSHYLPIDVANFHDETAKTVIENFDFDNLKNLEIDSPPSLKTVMQFAYEKGGRDVEIIAHTNSANSTITESVANPKDIKETTSHFYIAFKKGLTEEREKPFTMLAVGDIMLGRYVRIQSERKGNLEYPFELIRGKDDRFFNGFNLLFGNLEGPIYKDGVRSETSMIFGFNEDTAPMLASFGFDVLSIANNHTLNQRNDGLDSTVVKLNENGIGACGHPINITEGSVVYREIADKKLAFICFEDAVNRLDKDNAVELVKNIDSKADFVIVSPHFGIEYKHTPNNRQIELAHAFVDAGADIIIGTHPHVVQGFEVYNGVPIFYSLGNFIFDQYWSYDTQEELSLGLVVSDDYYKIYLFPMLSQKSQPYLMNTDKKTEFFEKLIKWGSYDDNMMAQIRSGAIEIQR